MTIRSHWWRSGPRIFGALADALPHPHDRAYTVTELYAWLQRCGLTFARWFEQAPYLPQCRRVPSMPRAPRLLLPRPRKQHAAVELLRGTMTKHNFIAYRDDRAGEAQPIAFDGDAWRKYVPLRLPSTLNQSGPCLSRPRTADQFGGSANLRRDRREAFCR